MAAASTGFVLESLLQVAPTGNWTRVDSRQL